MPRALRLRLGLLTLLALVGLMLSLGGAAAPKPAANPADDGFVFPPDRAVLLSGNFDVIYQGDDSPLQVNGEPYEWEAFQPPLHVAHLRLAPDVHELKIGNRRRPFVVAINEEVHDGPADWPMYGFHQMERGEDRCGDCHETSKKNGRIAVGDLSGYEACFVCHPSVEFDVTHSHPLEPIEHRQMCHALHGSRREGLLKAPAKQLCAECHDA